MGYLERHKNSGIKVGDKVKIIRGDRPLWKGSNQSISSQVDINISQFIGKTGQVEIDSGKYGFEVRLRDGRLYAFPYFVLEVQSDDKYGKLKKVLSNAEEHSSIGKGLERHATNNNFEDQVICVVQRLLKDHPFGGHAFQVIKKTIEAGRLYKIKGEDAAYQEVLGAINYLGAMGILIKERN